MSERPKSPSEEARAARLGRALRDNLKRRKAQSRGREAERRDAPHDAAAKDTAPRDKAADRR
jgi:hypothetical protein